MGIDNHDMGEQGRRIKIFAWTSPLGLLLAYELSPGLALGCFLAINLLIDRLICASGTGFAGLIYGANRRYRSVDELCQGDLQRVKFYRRHQRYSEALTLVDQVLAKAADYPDALYLKADILWHGFGDRQQALLCLKRIMGHPGVDATRRQWAVNFYRQLKSHASIDPSPPPVKPKGGPEGFTSQAE
jgi:hypothetical protein